MYICHLIHPQTNYFSGFIYINRSSYDILMNNNIIYKYSHNNLQKKKITIGKLLRRMNLQEDLEQNGRRKGRKCMEKR